MKRSAAGAPTCTYCRPTPTCPTSSSLTSSPTSVAGKRPKGNASNPAVRLSTLREPRPPPPHRPDRREQERSIATTLALLEDAAEHISQRLAVAGAGAQLRPVPPRLPARPAAGGCAARPAELAMAAGAGGASSCALVVSEAVTRDVVDASQARCRKPPAWRCGFDHLRHGMGARATRSSQNGGCC